MLNFSRLPALAAPPLNRLPALLPALLHASCSAPSTAALAATAGEPSLSARDASGAGDRPAARLVPPCAASDGTCEAESSPCSCLPYARSASSSDAARFSCPFSCSSPRAFASSSAHRWQLRSRSPALACASASRCSSVCIVSRSRSARLPCFSFVRWAARRSSLSPSCATTCSEIWLRSFSVRRRSSPSWRSRSALASHSAVKVRSELSNSSSVRGSSPPASRETMLLPADVRPVVDELPTQLRISLCEPRLADMGLPTFKTV